MHQLRRRPVANQNFVDHAVPSWQYVCEYRTQIGIEAVFRNGLLDNKMPVIV